MTREKGALRVYGESGLLFSETRQCLEAIECAYNSIYALDVALTALNDYLRDLEYYWRRIRPGVIMPLGLGLIPPLIIGARRGIQASWPPTAEQLASMVAPGDRLLFGGARFKSPGWWLVVGVAPILEVIRRYLNDRHERRKDKDFRNAAERRKFEQAERYREAILAWLEGSEISHRIEEARKLGAKESDIQPLLNSYLHQPLRGFAVYQDRGIIERAEIDKPRGQGEDR